MEKTNEPNLTNRLYLEKVAKDLSEVIIQLEKDMAIIVTQTKTKIETLNVVLESIKGQLKIDDERIEKNKTRSKKANKVMEDLSDGHEIKIPEADLKPKAKRKAKRKPKAEKKTETKTEI